MAVLNSAPTKHIMKHRKAESYTPQIMTTPNFAENFHYTYFSASTENTHELVIKLGGNNFRLNNQNALNAPVPYGTILVFPTYATRGRILPPPIGRFLSQEENRRKVQAIIGTGDFNFGQHFCFGGIKASEMLHVPLLGKIEHKGTQEDVQRVWKALEELNPPHIFARGKNLS